MKNKPANTLLAKAKQVRPAKRILTAWDLFTRDAKPQEVEEVRELIKEYNAGNLAYNFPTLTNFAEWLGKNVPHFNGLSTFTLIRVVKRYAAQ